MQRPKRQVFYALLLLIGLGACSDTSTPGAGGAGGGGNGTGATAGASGSSSSGGATQGGASGAGVSGGAGGSTGGNGGSSAGTGGTADAATDVIVAPDSDPPNQCPGNVDPYMPNLKKVGENGVLTFQLVEAMPAPPIRGVNTWTFRVLDAGGKSVGQGLSAKVDMPDHNHMISVEPDCTFDSMTETYEVTPLYYFMPGRWRATFTVNDVTSGATVDTVEFIFCIT